MAMTESQRMAAVAEAKRVYEYERIGVDADPAGPRDFDEVEDGVWVRAWVFVPQHQIPGYVMQPPAASSTIAVVQEPPTS